MNKEQALQFIQVTFETTFDKGRFSGFVRNLLNHIEDAPFTYRGNYIPEKFRQYIKTLERIGKYNDGEHTLDILIITLQKETSLERARTMQRNFIAWYLNGSRGGDMKDAALVVYVSPDQADWRFSLVKMDYKFEKTKTGKMKVKEEFTPARRWSFLVGVNEKSHTAKSRLVKILADDEHAPTLAELEEAFNIETVTKEFFLKYRELFLRTKEALDKVVKNDPKVKADFDAQGVDTVNFSKKLLGQIVFLYFLQKKGWFGVGRDDDWGTGSKHFLRELFEGRHGSYQNFFNDILEPLFYEALRIDRSHDDDYYSRFNCKIPFLNGGLFDPIGNYDWVHTDINLPNDLFSNLRKTKEGDKGDGILDVFDRYNFTVREDEPLEIEVAIDPELLGKAYEKFNAIRPDNFEEFTKALKSGKTGDENKFNKKFGVYYTPREIVHYMCKQSLINYLATRAEDAKLETPISKQDVEDLIEVGEMITEHEKTALVKEQNIKNGIQESTEYSSLLSDCIRQNAKIIDDWLADITVCDPAVGSGAFPVGMMNEIVRARNVLSVFLNNKERSDYEFKRRCIEHSLYGVDIDPGAVEIAKLRLWLSLVVDEENIKNIKPLPNLDYKIVCGNSLIGLPEYAQKVKGVEEIQELKAKFFSETNPENKCRLKNEIDNKIEKFLSTTKKNLGYHVDFEFRIYFSEVFNERGGFDVVIANPPYGADIPKHQLIEIKKRMKDTINSNSAAIFIDFSKNNIINTKGIVTFIVPKSLLYSEKWFSLAKALSQKTSVLVDVEKGFENVLLEQVVFIFNQARIFRKYQALKFNEGEFSRRSHIPIKLINKYKTWLCDVFETDIKIAEKITKEAVFLKEISSTTRGLPLQSKLKETGDIPVIGGREIQRYSVAGTKGFISEKFISSNKKARVLLQPKILSQNIVAHIENPKPHIQIVSTVDITGNVMSVDTINNTFITNNSYSILYVLALLNSYLVSWYTYKFIYACAIRTMHFDNSYIGKIPLKHISKSDQKPLICIVEQILAITKHDDYLQNPQKQARVKELEREIDKMVYQLYGLSDEDIRIVEGEGK